MTALRIGVDGHILTGKRQGTRTWLHELLLRTPQLLPDAEFVVYSHDPRALAGAYPAPNVRVVPMPHWAAPLRLLAFWPWAVRRDRLDALLTQYFCPPTTPSRQVVVVHDVLFEDHPEFFPLLTRLRNRALVRLSARRAGRVLTVSEYSRDRLVHAYGLRPDEVGVVRNGASAPAPVPGPGTAGIAPATARPLPYVLFVGRLEPRKNLGLALDAFARRQDRASELVVVGTPDGESPAVLERLRTQEGVVHLEGVGSEDLAGLYRQAAALLFPSLGEGWGIPVLEALSHDCPVVASSLTAVPECGGDVCTYVDPTATDAAAVLAARVDDALAGRLHHDSAAVREHVAANSWDAAARSLAAELSALGRGEG